MFQQHEQQKGNTRMINNKLVVEYVTNPGQQIHVPGT